MQFQNLAEDNDRLQDLHKAMKTQYEKFLLQLKYSVDTLLKQGKNETNLTYQKIIYDTALKLRSEIGIQIESIRKQFDA